MSKLSRRVWFESLLATASFLLLVLTIAWRDWAEALFRIDPDQGGGAFEALVTVGLACATLALIASAGVEVRRVVASLRASSVADREPAASASASDH